MIEYILEGESIELSDTTIIELSYSIADIRDPIKINNPFSKTIEIPGTKNNNRIFDFLYQNNIQPGYNPNLKKNVEIRVDTIPIIVGYQKIDEVVIENGTITYNVIVYGSNTTIFEDMGDSLLTDLDLSEYEQTYTKTVVSDSWENTIRKGYYYPFINHSDKKWTYQDIWDSGNTYPFYPSFYVKTLIDKIFETYGYEYDSNFFNSETFKSLIIPFNGRTTSNNNILVVENKFIMECLYQSCNDYFYVISETDPAGIYSVYAGDTYATIQTPSDGLWTFTITGSTISMSGGTQHYFENGSFTIFSRIIGGTDTTQLFKIDLTNPGSSTTQYDFSFSFSIPDKILKDRKIYVMPESYSPSMGNSLYKSGYMFSQTWDFNTELPIQSVTVYKPSETLPVGLKQKELLQNLIRMFNLHIEATPNNEKLLTIEPFTDYYNRSTDTVDWTYKVDNRSKRYKLMSELGAKNYTFLYKDDNDYLTKTYKDITKKTIGETTIDVETDFTTNEEKIEMLSSPAPVEILNDTDQLIMTSLHKEPLSDPPTGYTGVIKTDWNWRILSQNPKEDVPIRLFQGQYICIRYNSLLFDTYWTASHICNYKSSTDHGVSLYFNEVYTDFLWDVNSMEGNLYTKYWKNYIDLIKNQNSRLLTMDVYLTDSDISNLRFYEKIFIEDSWYMLNRLLYNPYLKKSKAELLLIPTSFIEDIKILNYTLSNTINLLISGTFNVNFQIKNLSEDDYSYSGSVIIKDLSDNVISTTSVSGIVYKNELKSDIKAVTAPSSTGTYKVYLYFEDIYNQYKTITTNALPTLVLTSISNITENSLRVNWSESPRYSVYLSGSTNEDFTDSLDDFPKTTSRNYLNVIGLDSYTDYHFRGCYVSGSNYGSTSNIISGKTSQVLYYIEAEHNFFSFDGDGTACWNGGYYDNFQITSNDSWTATPSDAWISIYPDSGTGDSNINITVSSNGGSARSGTIYFECDNLSVANVTVNVYQSGSGGECLEPI